jgi:hypothetical protein
VPTNVYTTELRSIRAALHQLHRSLDRLSSALSATQGTEKKPSHRTLRLTAARRAALKLQGRYMGHLRGLKPRQKAQVKRIRAEKGIRAAIAAAKRLSS